MGQVIEKTSMIIVVMGKQKIPDTLQRNPGPGKISAVKGIVMCITRVDLKVPFLTGNLINIRYAQRYS